MTEIFSKELTVDVWVSITSDGNGGYRFAYSGKNFRPNGDFDFSKGEPRKHAVKIDFAITDDSVKGIAFKPNGDDALWIVEKDRAGPDGCPQGPYKGDQFKGIATTANGKRLHVIDKNDDSTLYRYMLRFDLNGETIVDDPDGQNGGSS